MRGLVMGVGGIWDEGDRKGYPLRKRVVDQAVP